MANSYVNYVGNGALTNYTVPFPYLDQSHVKVQVNGADQAFTWFSPTQVRLTVTNGQVFTVRRITPTATPIVDYSNGNVLTEADLDASALQTLYAVQESADNIADFGDELDALTISAGAVPVPSNPTDNGKVLTASAGVYGWQDLDLGALGSLNTVSTAVIDNNAVTTAKIADNTVTTAKIVDNNVTTAKILDGAVTAAKVATDVATTTGTQSLTNKTLTTPVINQPTVNQPNIVGVATDSNAAAGSVGELLSATVVAGAAVSLTNNTETNIVTLSLTAGDWDVEGLIVFTSAASTNYTQKAAGISVTSNALPAAGQVGRVVHSHAAYVPAGRNYELNTGRVRVSLASTTTYYLVGSANFTVAAATAYGQITARRVR